MREALQAGAFLEIQFPILSPFLCFSKNRILIKNKKMPIYGMESIWSLRLFRFFSTLLLRL
jgi:hypothetical protein